MSTEQIRTLRHDLRTPINHIMGYSELLLEEATDSADNATVSRFSNICKLGERLLKILEQALPSSEKWGTEHFVNLHMCAKPVIETVIVLSAPGECAEDYVEISGKIHQAAQALLNHIERLQFAAA
jgi:signal transduction histidine kinase